MSINYTQVSADRVYSSNSWSNLHTQELPAGNTVSVNVKCMARRSDNGDCAKWEVTALFKRDGSGPVQLVQSVVNLITPIKTLGALLWDFRLRTDNDEFLYLDGKGSSGNDVGWFVWGEVYSLNYPA